MRRSTCGGQTQFASLFMLPNYCNGGRERATAKRVATKDRRLPSLRVVPQPNVDVPVVRP